MTDESPPVFSTVSTHKPSPPPLSVEDLRFSVGDRVLANAGRDADRWQAGTIVQLHYHEDEWEPDRIEPYQVELDDGKLIYACFDEDSSVRKIPNDPLKLLAHCSDLEKQPEECNGVGKCCPRHHLCGDGPDCPNYHCCGAIGRLRKKMVQRRGKDFAPTPDNNSQIQIGIATATNEPLLEDVLAFIEGPRGEHSPLFDGKSSKQKKKKRKPEQLSASDGFNKNCPIHSFAAAGRRTLVCKLLDGIDFSPLFREQGYEENDLDDDFEATLAAFSKNLTCGHCGHSQRFKFMPSGS